MLSKRSYKSIRPRREITIPGPARPTAKQRKPNALHEKIIKLLSRPNGANITDIQEAKFKGPTISALRIAERRGMKTSVVKKLGELSRYIARRA